MNNLFSLKEESVTTSASLAKCEASLRQVRHSTPPPVADDEQACTNPRCALAQLQARLISVI